MAQVLNVQIPIVRVEEEKFRLSNVYVRTFSARNRNWNVHFVSDAYHIFIMPREEAEKLLKMKYDARAQWLSENYYNQYPLVRTDRSYVSYPDEYNDYYEVIIPEELVKKMKEQNLVLVIIKDYEDYEDKFIAVDIVPPEDIEKWEKKELVLDRDELAQLGLL